MVVVRFIPWDGISPLCSAWVNDIGELIIVDRLPIQETSQLPESALLMLLREARNLVRAPQDEPITVYLPRIHASMFAEARIQRLIHELDPNLTIISI